MIGSSLGSCAPPPPRVRGAALLSASAAPALSCPAWAKNGKNAGIYGKNAECCLDKIVVYTRYLLGLGQLAEASCRVKEHHVGTGRSSRRETILLSYA